MAAMKASADDGDSARNWRRVLGLAVAPTAATALVFIPLLLRSPSTTEATPGLWLVALVVAAPLAAYLTSRRLGVALNFPTALLVGLPQMPVTILLSMAAVWSDVQSGHLLPGSGEEAMSYGIGSSVASVAGAILLILVAVAARLGARPASRGRLLG